jgi:hypothetical protein
VRGASLDASRARAWFEGTGREGPHRAAAQDGLTLRLEQLLAKACCSRA